MRAALLMALLSTSALAEPEAFGLPVDKVLHASISANLTLGLTALCRAAGCSPTVAMLVGAGATLALGAVKELVWDLAMHRGNAEVADFAFDVLGAGAAFVCVGIVFSVGVP